MARITRAARAPESRPPNSRSAGRGAGSPLGRCSAPAGGSLPALPARMATPLRATEGLKPRVHVGGGPPFCQRPRGSAAWRQNLGQEGYFFPQMQIIFLSSSALSLFLLSISRLFLPLPHFTLFFSLEGPCSGEGWIRVWCSYPACDGGGRKLGQEVRRVEEADNQQDTMA